MSITVSKIQGAVVLPIALAGHHSGGFLNPSVIRHAGALYILLRKVQYVMHHADYGQKYYTPWGPLAYIHPDSDRTLTTTNWLCILDESALVGGTVELDPVLIDTSQLDVKPMWTFVGLEDARLVTGADGGLWITGVRRDTTPNGVGRMELSKLHVTERAGRIISAKETKRVRINPDGDYTYCEKNWMPVKFRPYDYVRWANPARVERVVLGDSECEEDRVSAQSVCIHMSDTSTQTQREMRGGSHLIPVEGGYLAVVHEVDFWYNYMGGKDAIYYHRFVTFDSDLNLTGCSAEFKFLGFRIEFCVGLETSEDGHDLIIPFSVQDNSAFILRMPKRTALEMITKTDKPC